MLRLSPTPRARRVVELSGYGSRSRAAASGAPAWVRQLCSWRADSEATANGVCARQPAPPTFNLVWVHRKKGSFCRWTHPSARQGVGVVRSQAPFAVATDRDRSSSVHDEKPAHPSSRPRGVPENGCPDPQPSHHAGEKQATRQAAGEKKRAPKSPHPNRLPVGEGSDIQCRKWRTPEYTITTPRSSAASITS